MPGGGGGRRGSQHYQLESHAHPWGCNLCFPGSSGRSGGDWVTDLFEMILIPYISPTCTIHCCLVPSELSNHHYYQFWNISITPKSHSCSLSDSTHSTPRPPAIYFPSRPPSPSPAVSTASTEPLYLYLDENQKVTQAHLKPAWIKKYDHWTTYLLFQCFTIKLPLTGNHSFLDCLLLME